MSAPISPRPDQPPTTHRSLFLSDLHLGSLGCRADLILEFLERNSADTIYLVGDILDIWHPIRPHWTEAHVRIVTLLETRRQAGARIVYLLGNHDAPLRRAPHLATMAGEMCDSLVHEAANGRRYLVLHGDVADARLLRWHWMTRLGSHADHLLRRVDQALRRLRSSARQPERSPIEWLLAQVNSLISAGKSHERRLLSLALGQGCEGLICGHFHKPALHRDHGLLYANCGDWVDSFTAIAEDRQGTLSMIGGRAAFAAAVETACPLPAASPAEGVA